MKYLLVDGYNLAYRSYFSMPTALLTTDTKVSTHFLVAYKILKKAIEKLGIDKVVVFIDVGKSKRLSDYKEYKAKRKPMPSFLKETLPDFWKFLYYLGANIIGISNQEADDLIATFVEKFEGEKYILSNDFDLMQLLEMENVYQVIDKSSKFEVFNKKKFMEKYGFEPKFIPDFKALAGDSSDNIPGISGIGTVTAKKLIEKYGDLENILKNSGNKKLKGKEDEARKWYDLTKLKKVEDIEFNVDARKFLVDLNSKSLRKILLDYELNFILKELKFETDIDIPNGNFVKEEKKNFEKISILKIKDKYFAFDGSKFYEFDSVSQIKSKKIFSWNEWISNETIDLYLITSLITSTNMDLEKAVKRFLPFNVRESYGLFFDEKKSLLVKLLYLGERINLQKYNWLNEIYSLEKNLSKYIRNIEARGLYVDVEKLKEIINSDEEKLREISREISNLLGYSLNPNSPKQVVEFLKKIGVKGKKITSEQSFLDKFVDKHPVIKLIIEYKKISKLKSMAVSILEKVKKDTVYPIIHQIGTTTGRIVTENPNIQNIPINGKLREVFKPRKGKIFLVADYSQLELRIVASLAEEEKMLEIFKEEEDLHTITASLLFNKDRTNITKEERKVAKIVNFSILYGKQAFGLAQDLNISIEEANNLIENYYNTFPKLRKWQEKIEEKALSTLEVFSKFYRRKQVPEVISLNKYVREHALRQVINYPVQATASDLFKKVLLKIEERLPNMLLATIHDEVILEVDRNIVQDVKELLVDIMKSIDDEFILDVEVNLKENLIK